MTLLVDQKDTAAERQGEMPHHIRTISQSSQTKVPFLTTTTWKKSASPKTRKVDNGAVKRSLWTRRFCFREAERVGRRPGRHETRIQESVE